MVQLSLISGGVTTQIEADENTKVGDFKKIVEQNLPESKKIQADKQILYLNAKKMEDDKQLSDYIDPAKKDNLRVIVLKQVDPKAKNVYTQGQEQTSVHQPSVAQSPSNNPYSYAPPQTPQYNPYMQQQQPGYNYHMPPSYPPYYMPPQMHGGMPGGGLPIQKEHIDLVMNNPSMIDTIINLQNPNMSQEEKERTKKIYMDTFKMLQNSPDLLNSLTQTAGQQQYMPQYQPMYNPYYPPMSPGMPPMSPQMPPMSRDAAKAKFKNELNTLKEMGFVDEERNLTALMQAHGDLNVALDFLSRGGF